MVENIDRPIIAINRLFAGRYLSNHIGHEVINMFQSDNGKNYIYLQPYGTYAAKHYGKIGYVLLARGVEGKRALELLGLATHLTDIFNPKDCNPWTHTREYIKKNNVRYGDVSLLDIFVHNEGDVDAQNVYLTMEAETVMRPKKPTYIVFGSEEVQIDKNTIYLSYSNQAKTSLKQYFLPGDEDYEVLRRLINDKTLWTIPTTQIGKTDSIPIKEDNFFDICGIDDYELAFSNALAFFMDKYPELVVGFAKDRLAKNIKPFPVVERETHNIDILLKNEEMIVVIENKITSKINGVKIKNHQVVDSQLSKYYKYAKEERQKDKPKKVACFIITPNYNSINLSEFNLPDFDCEHIYQQISYKEIYDFLKGKHPEDAYLQEFIKGIEKHTKNYHNDLFEETLTKFARQIKTIKNV